MCGLDPETENVVFVHDSVLDDFLGETLLEEELLPSVPIGNGTSTDAAQNNDCVSARVPLFPGYEFHPFMNAFLPGQDGLVIAFSYLGLVTVGGQITAYFTAELELEV